MALKPDPDWQQKHEEKLDLEMESKSTLLKRIAVLTAENRKLRDPLTISKLWEDAEGRDSSYDKPLPEDEEIQAAFPTNSGEHEIYAEALRLVNAKHSKYGLVDLVNWLLHRITKQATGQVYRFRSNPPCGTYLGVKEGQPIETAVFVRVYKKHGLMAQWTKDDAFLVFTRFLLLRPCDILMVSVP